MRTLYRIGIVVQLIILITSINNRLFSQKIYRLQFTGGISKTSTKNYDFDFHGLEWLWCPFIEGKYNIRLNDKLCFNIGINIFGEGNLIDIKDLRNTNNEIFSVSDYEYFYKIGLPNNLSFRFFSRLSFKAGLEPSFSVLFHKYYLMKSSQGYKKEKSKTETNFDELALDAQLSVSYEILQKEKWSLSLICAFNQNLISIYSFKDISSPFDSWKYRILSGISIGFMPYK